MILIFFLVLYIASLNSNLMKKIYDIRYASAWFKSDWRYGNLYEMSYIPEFRIEIPRFRLSKKQCYENTKNVNLYVTCDSFVGLGQSTAWMDTVISNDKFCNVNLYKSVWRGRETIIYKRDSTKTNVLIIELVDPEPRFMFADTTIYWSNRNNIFAENVSNINISSTNNILSYIRYLNNSLHKMIFNREINQNIEFNMFSNPIFRYFKEWKAWINTNIFKHESQVIISRDNKYLYHRPTIDPSSKSSPLNQISDDELNKIINNINSIYDSYKKMGFDEIYLSIIPNRVTITDPNLMNYNMLIPKIQNNKNLKMPIIDIYTEMIKKYPLPLFLRSDTHWNEKGLQLWIDLVNNGLNPEKWKDLK